MSKQQEKTAMKKLAVLVFFMCWYAPGVRAEFDTDINGTNTFNDLNLDPNGNPAPNVQNSSLNPTEGAVLQNTVFNQTLRADNPNLNNLDVSDKYGQAGSAGSAQAGKIAAIATGASLMAAGVPMSASIIPSVKAAGYALIAKAALEFAQAAASGRLRPGTVTLRQ
ncbi:MAG: hypothetical protein R3B54_08300 [Bdellovibrionota bacterium]